MEDEAHHQPHLPSSSSSSSSLTSLHDESSEEQEHEEELRHMVLTRPLINQRKRLSKQLSMCETPQDAAWEKRRRQFLLTRERRKSGNIYESPSSSVLSSNESMTNLTDEDLHELKGCIDLGFGFNEEDGQGLTNTLPALDLYFAVNRQYSPSPVSTPNGSSSSPRSESDSWKICSPGDDPQQVKTKLRHWAQAVACSVKQSY